MKMVDRIKEQDGLIETLNNEVMYLTAEHADDEEQHKLAVTRITELAAEFAESKEQNKTLQLALDIHKDEFTYLYKKEEESKEQIIRLQEHLETQTSFKEQWHLASDVSLSLLHHIRANPLVSFLLKIKIVREK